MGYTVEQVQKLLGLKCYKMYEQLNNFILDNYNVNQIWSDGGKYGKVCLRYNRSGKTLCTLYLRENQLGIWIILGEEERRKFAEKKDSFSAQVQEKVQSTEIFHDGQWVMFDVENADLFWDVKLLLAIKKTPNRKLNMCGYCCDMCKALVTNIKKKDEREKLSEYWETYYALCIPTQNIVCDGCRCKKSDAHRIDDSCPIRACVQEKKLTDCSECDYYPCETFMTRKGLSYEEANEICELDIESFYEYLWAFDNQPKLDRKLN